MNFRAFFPYDRDRPIIFCEDKREIARSYDPLLKGHTAVRLQIMGENARRRRGKKIFKKHRKSTSINDQTMFSKKTYEPCSFIAWHGQ